MSSSGKRDGSSGGGGAQAAANPRPPRRTALEMAAPPLPGETQPRPRHPKGWGWRLRPLRRRPCRGALPGKRRAGSWRGTGASTAPPPAAGRRGRRGSRGAGRPSPAGGGQLAVGRLPAHGAATASAAPLPRASALPPRGAAAAASAALAGVCEPPGGSSRSASDRDAPPARPHLEPALPPRAAGAAASPAARRPPRPGAAVPPVPVPAPAELRAASPRPRRPAAAAAPLAPSRGEGDSGDCEAAGEERSRRRLEKRAAAGSPGMDWASFSASACPRRGGR